VPAGSKAKALDAARVLMHQYVMADVNKDASSGTWAAGELEKARAARRERDREAAAAVSGYGRGGYVGEGDDVNRMIENAGGAGAFLDETFAFVRAAAGAEEKAAGG
jgi:hypothetical protein